MYRFEFEYRPGRINVADPLSRAPHASLNLLLNTLLTGHGYQETGASAHRTQTAPMSEPVHEMLSFAEDLSRAYQQDPRFQNPEFTKDFHQEQELWWREAQIVVPQNPDIIKTIIEDSHSAPYGGHYGVNKTVKAIQRYFWWPNMNKDVHSYVTACGPCQRNKSMPTKPKGPLQILPPPKEPWESVGMDFIVELPRTKNGNNAILTFVDRLTKKTHLVPTTTNCDAVETAKLFMDHVFKHHGLPRAFVTDRGTQFTSGFFKELCRLWKIQQCFSTAYHPRSNGQTERMNRIVEDMIRHYVSPTHDDWDEHLTQIEFAINNAHHEGLKNTPFYMNYRRNPLTPLTAQLPVASSASSAGKIPKVYQLTRNQTIFLTRARRCLQSAQDRQKYYFDKNVSPVSFQIGQEVLLSTRNINLTHPGSNKLLPRWIGPFPIEQQIGTVAFKLQLPDTMKRIHHVFHASLLTNYVPGGELKPLPPILMDDGSLEYEVEKILDSRVTKKGKRHTTEYYIKWLGYDHSYDTWEPAANLHCPQLLKEFLHSRETSIRAASKNTPTKRKSHKAKRAIRD